ncbi:MAG: GNAT family N-acetyltransferase [Oscillospiraceae bacterium]|nr:GNAT family N-acetyltransferase [Oscillospiraceae bacterium]
MTKIYLIRHAEAEGNIYRRLQGQFDGRITPNGLVQIAALQRRFADIPIDAVYASDLYRTRKTAEAIYLPKGLPLHTDPRFREVHVGVWENLPFGWLARTEPERLEAFRNDPEHWIVPGAECFEQYSGRFAAGVTELAQRHDGQSIAILTHGCVLSGGLNQLLGLPFDFSKSDNTTVCLLDYENGRFSPVYLFDHSHLSEAISTRARQRWWRKPGVRFELWFREAEAEDAALYDAAWQPAPEDRVWIAMLEEEAVGYVAVRDAGISCLWLKPEYRHRHMGDQLFGQAVSCLRSAGVEALSLGVPTFQLEALSFLTRLCGNPVQMDDCYTVFRMELAVPKD